MTEPPRLPEHLRALIAAEDAAPAGGDREAVRARVLASVGAGVVVGTTSVPTAGGAAAVGLAGKLAIVVLVAGAIGGGAALLGRRAERSTWRGASPSSTSLEHEPGLVAPPSSTSIENGPTVVAPPSSTSSENGPTVVAPHAPGSATAPAIASPRPPSPAPALAASRAPRRATAAAPSVDAQATLLHRAWQSLAGGDAAAALATVELDARTHPTGALAEEREALRLDALLRLSRTAEARERARAFATRYPASIHRDLVTRALGESR